MFRREHTLVFAICASVVVHILFLRLAPYLPQEHLVVGKGGGFPTAPPSTLPSTGDDDALPTYVIPTAPEDPPPPPQDPMAAVPPPPPPPKRPAIDPIDINGEHNGTGEAINQSPGDQEAKSVFAKETPQAFLSRDPEGPGAVGAQPSNSLARPGEGGTGNAGGGGDGKPSVAHQAPLDPEQPVKRFGSPDGVADAFQPKPKQPPKPQLSSQPPPSNDVAVLLPPPDAVVGPVKPDAKKEAAPTPPAPPPPPPAAPPPTVAGDAPHPAVASPVAPTAVAEAPDAKPALPAAPEVATPARPLVPMPVAPTSPKPQPTLKPTPGVGPAPAAPTVPGAVALPSGVPARPDDHVPPPRAGTAGAPKSEQAPKNLPLPSPVDPAKALGPAAPPAPANGRGPSKPKQPTKAVDPAKPTDVAAASDAHKPNEAKDPKPTPKPPPDEVAILNSPTDAAPAPQKPADSSPAAADQPDTSDLGASVAPAKPVEVAMAKPTPPLPKGDDPAADPDRNPLQNPPAAPAAIDAQGNAAPPGPKGRAGKPGSPSPAADPAPQSDSESDPIAKRVDVVIRNGRVDARAGRKVRTVRPQLTVAGWIDAASLGDPSVILAVVIDAAGNPTEVHTLRSSGSDNIDLPCERAVNQWWFEPTKDPRTGKTKPDVVVVHLSF